MKKKASKKTVTETTIFIVCGIVSLCSIILGACLQQIQVISTIFVGVGCSGLAASLMSIAMRVRDINAEKERIDRERRTVLRRIHNELKTVLQKILWFDARIDDTTFNWDLPDEQYATLNYMLSAHSKYKDSPSMTFEEAKIRLETIEKKYSLESQKSFDEKRQKTTEKLYRIIYCNSVELVKALRQLIDDKIMMNTIGYITLDELKSLQINIITALEIMCKPQKNYGVAVMMLLTAYETIRKKGNYTDEITISLQGTYSMSEL